jgi:hypothetical protein
VKEEDNVILLFYTLPERESSLRLPFASQS